VPKQALCIQIGASNFLAETLSKCLPDAVHLTLTKYEKTKQSDNERLTYFWQQLGQVHLSGYDLKPCSLLIPEHMKSTLFPVPVNTPFLSGIAKLMYLKQAHQVRKRRSIQESLSSNSRQFLIDMNEPKYCFLLGHTINGKCVLPVSAFIYMVWQTFGIDNTPIEFVNIDSHQKIQLNSGIRVALSVSVEKRTGEFRIVLVDSDCVVCEGQVRKWVVGEGMLDMRLKTQSVGMEEIYERLEAKGHGLTGEFRSIVSMDATGSCGQIAWTHGKWIALLDGSIFF